MWEVDHRDRCEEVQPGTELPCLRWKGHPQPHYRSDDANSQRGIANVWLCGNCGRFEFTKPEKDGSEKKRGCCSEGSMTLLLEQAVIQVRPRPDAKRSWGDLS